MTTTNYLSPEDFKKMVDAIPLVTEYNKSKLIGVQKERVPDFKQLQACLWVQYCHGLRVSEVKQLTKEHFNFERKILTLEKTKTGYKKKDGVKVRKKQFTSIPPDLPKWVKDGIEYYDPHILFPFTRQLIWSYVKKAAEFAKLELGEQQDERFIEGAWTHLIRKSRAKMMIEKGASEVMVKVKLRHTFSVTERYTKPDINALIKWEEENL
jgi:integrase